MHPEFSDHGKVWRHFSGAIGGDVHGLTADQNVKCARVKDDAGLRGGHRFPKIGNRIVVKPVKINQAGMGFGAVSDNIAKTRRQINRKAEAIINMGVGIDQPLGCVQHAQIVI